MKNTVKFFRISVILAAIVLTFTIPGCREPQEGNNTVSVTGVTLNKTILTLTRGGTDTLKHTVEPANATNQKVTWTSDNTNVATVDSTGKVTVRGSGTAKITVTTEDGAFKAECTVRERSAAVDSIADGLSDPGGAGITVELFDSVGIIGVTSDNLYEITKLLEAISDNMPPPNTLPRLKNIVDLALIAMAAADENFIDSKNYANQKAMEDAITALIKNESSASFIWTDDNVYTVNVIIGVYSVEIVFEDIETGGGCECAPSNCDCTTCSCKNCNCLSCGNTVSISDLKGTVTITPNTGITIGNELTASYNGNEVITIIYQWKKGGVNVGTNSNKYTPYEDGSYTVTVSARGYNSKTSNPVTIYPGNAMNFGGNISISAATTKLPSNDTEYDVIIPTGEILTATYSGTEGINIVYQWKRDGNNVGNPGILSDSGARTATYRSDKSGNYTITISYGLNFIPKESAPVIVYDWNSAKPIIYSKYTADPSAHVWPAWNSINSSFEPRLFLYPSQDVYPPAGCNKMDRYHVFSTNNMVDWIDHGEILRRDDLPVNQNGWGPHHADAMFMWAPDAAYREGVSGKGPYFFYFPHATGDSSTWGETWKIGVTWSTDPHQGFDGSKAVILKDHLGNELNIGGKQQGNLIDPCIFVDEDLSGNKKYYFMTGGSQECRIAELADDMVSLKEPLTELTSQLDRYHEGPWMFYRYTGYPNKTGTKMYYLMYPGHTEPARKLGADMAYATSTEGPKGPWTYRGSILDEVGTGDTSHGSIVEFNGKWYIFYHNDALRYMDGAPGGGGGGGGALRSVCVDEVFFDANGLIQKIEPSVDSVARNGPEHNFLQESKLNTLFGAGKWELEPKGPPPPPNPDEYNKDAEYPVTVSPSSGTASLGVTTGLPAKIQYEDGDYVVGHFGAGAFLKYTDVIQGGSGGKVLFGITYATANGGNVAVEVEGISDKFYIGCPSTGSWTKNPDGYKDAYGIIELKAGLNTLTITGGDVNIRSISIYFPGS